MKRNFRILTIALFIILSASLVFAGGGKEAAPAAPAAGNQLTAVENAVAKYYDELPAHIYKISQKEFAQKVNAGDDMYVIDIRSAADYAKGHITGAVNMPWGTALYDNLQYIPQSGEVFIYCYSGQTAGQAVMLLNAAGVPARSVNLGFKWGLSKVPGVEAIITTEASEIDKSKTYDVNPEIAEAYKAYYARFAEIKGTPFASNIVSEENAKKILDSGDDSAVFVSIRKADDYAKEHIATATNIPWGKSMHKGFDVLPTDKKIIIYCYTGQTAGQTVAALRLLGYDAVSLKGGMGMDANAPLGWKNKGYPVVSD